MTVASSSDFCMSNKFVAQVTGSFRRPSIVARGQSPAAQPPQQSGDTARDEAARAQGGAWASGEQGSIVRGGGVRYPSRSDWGVRYPAIGPTPHPAQVVVYDDDLLGVVRGGVA